MTAVTAAGRTGIQASLQHIQGDFSLDVALDLPGTGVTAIFGLSGSGKTSLLRSIAGLQRASGQLTVNGDVWQDDRAGIFVAVHQRALGFVFQEASLFSHLDVQKNLDYGRCRVPDAQQRVPLAQAIELLGLQALLKRQTGTLSGGERQRVAIARALASSPRLLLMDEPLASLDGIRKAEILPYIEKLQIEFAIPVLYVSHAPDEVARLADFMVLLEGGRVLAAGPTRELMTRMDLPLAHGDAAAAVVDAVVVRVEPNYHLSYADFPGGQISLLNSQLRLGQRVRLRVQARDVSLTLQRQSGSSVLNVFAVTVISLSADSPGQVMVALDAGGSSLLARITQKSADTLELRPGQALYAQVKGVAILG